MTYFRSNREAVSTLTTPGHIYFIQAESGGLVKIGWATCPKTRMARMQAHGPLKLVLMHSEPGNGKEEKEIHRRFAVDRRHGEWFEPSPALLAEINARRGRNTAKTYEPGAPAPGWSMPDPPRERRKAKRREKQGPPGPPQAYWEPGSPGWNKLKVALNALG